MCYKMWKTQRNWKYCERLVLSEELGGYYYSSIRSMVNLMPATKLTANETA